MFPDNMFTVESTKNKIFELSAKKKKKKEFKLEQNKKETISNAKYAK